jgi:hypothetical protein
MWAVGKMREHEQQAAARRASLLAAAQEVLRAQEGNQEQQGPGT